ncbi:MAG: reverse transcriptase-like protein, partial [bacterium]
SALAQILGLDIDQVGFKVKRGEGLGFVGTGEGTMAFSTALLTRPRMKRKKEQEKSVDIYTDGGSKGNPGPSACSCIFSVAGKILYVYGESLGWTTNNVAEYCGVLLGMKEALKRGYERIVIHSDSELLVRQMKGEYEITDEKLRERAEEIREISREFRSVKWELITREENRLAHRIVELILEGEK